MENADGTKKKKIIAYFVYVGGVLFSVSGSAVISSIGFGGGVDAIVYWSHLSSVIILYSLSRIYLIDLDSKGKCVFN
jgi:hypothetical protein